MSIIPEILFKGGFLALTIVLIRRIMVVFSAKKVFWKELLDPRALLVEFIFLCLLMTSFLIIEGLVDKKFYLFLIGAFLLVPLVMSFDFLIKPYFYAFFDRSSRRSPYFEKVIKERFDRDYFVYILDKEIVNVYATGLYGKSKSILIGKGLLEKMDEKHVLNLLAHEIGHLDQNHMFRAYLANITASAIFMISSYLLYPLFATFGEYTEGAMVAIHGCFLGLLLLIIPGFVQKKFELEADRYAANMVGKEDYCDTLLKLNEITNREMEKTTINYPPLSKRLKSVHNLIIEN